MHKNRDTAIELQPIHFLLESSLGLPLIRNYIRSSATTAGSRLEEQESRGAKASTHVSLPMRRTRFPTHCFSQTRAAYMMMMMMGHSVCLLFFVHILAG